MATARSTRSQTRSGASSQPIPNQRSASNSDEDGAAASLETSLRVSPVSQQDQNLQSNSISASKITFTKKCREEDDLESCGHSLHPAYADAYTSPLCPSCQFDRCVTNSRKAALTITVRGGGSLWLENISFSLEGEAQRDAQMLHRFILGNHKRFSKQGKDLHIHKNGEDISYPRGKTTLLKHIAELEDIREKEKAWETSNPLPSLSTETQQRLKDAQISSATNALRRWHAHTKKSFDKVEDLAAKASRKRARAMTLALEANFPDPQDYYPTTHPLVLTLTQEQKTFIAASTPAPETTPDPDPPKRKRRRLDATVEFDTHTYVHTETDTDVIFRSPGINNTIHIPPLQPILRTEQRHMHPPPSRPHTRTPLAAHDKAAAKVRRWTDSHSSPGYVRVDTSGHKFRRDWDSWEQYCKALGDDLGGGEREMESGGQAALGDAALGDGVEEDEFPGEEEVEDAVRRIRGWEDGQRRGVGGAGLGRGPGESGEGERSRARFRPHGGMASICALGSFVGGAVVDVVRRVRFS